MKQLYLPSLDLRTGTRTAQGDVLQRANWWEPFTWKRTGIGMSAPYRDDYSTLYKVKDEEIISANFYGLEHKKTFLPLQTVLEFSNNRLAIDRALHRLGSRATIYDVKTFKEEGTISKCEHTLLWDRRCDYNYKNIFEEPALDEFPFKNARKAERLVEGLQGFTLDELVLRGNNTLAVGFLIGVVIPILKTEEKMRYVKIGTWEIGEESLIDALGEENKHLAPFYVLRAQGGFIADGKENNI